MLATSQEFVLKREVNCKGYGIARSGPRGPWDHGDARLDLGETIPLLRLCGSASRIVDQLGAGVQSLSTNMLSLRTPTWGLQDSVYLVANPSVAQLRMPRPRYMALKIMKPGSYWN